MILGKDKCSLRNGSCVKDCDPSFTSVISKSYFQRAPISTVLCTKGSPLLFMPHLFLMMISI